mmetsp:Transcript_41459/g.74373  ORF Transcript_41459/g.74373 Transcript_41459/m.74373 type:complete len:80 (-) Transcript_41459:1051-1290(-)
MSWNILILEMGAHKPITIELEDRKQYLSDVCILHEVSKQCTDVAGRRLFDRIQHKSNTAEKKNNPETDGNRAQSVHDDY